MAAKVAASQASIVALMLALLLVPSGLGAADPESVAAAQIDRRIMPISDGPESGSYISFKRIAAPAKGSTGKRITVQIALGAPITPLPVAPKDPPIAEVTLPPEASGASDWFWSQISPGLSPAAGSAQRLIDALALLEQAREGGVISGPRPSLLQKIADRYGAAILRETSGTRVSPALVLALIAIESAGRSDAVSPAGASGLLQLMPDTATRFGVTDRSDPDQSLRGGIAYLDWLLQEFGGDPLLALAGYNAGEGALHRNLGVPPYAETRGYVPKVLMAWKVARGLCLTPPDLPGDGCVFAVRTAAAK